MQRSLLFTLSLTFAVACGEPKGSARMVPDANTVRLADAGSAPDADQNGSGDAAAGDADGAPDASGTQVREAAQDGTRLKAEYFDAEGGARTFSSFFDSMLGTRCFIELDSSGEYRCMPVAYGEIAYSDADCRTPVVLLYEFGDEGDYATTSEGLVLAGAPLELQPTYYYKDGSDCWLDDIGLPAGGRTHQLRERVDENRFVKFQDISTPSSARIRAQVFLGTDGARLQHEAYDTAFNEVCNGAGDDRCIPHASRVSRFRGGPYFDQTCAHPAVRLAYVWSRQIATIPGDPSSCTPIERSYFELGLEISPEQIAEKDADGQCFNAGETSGSFFVRGRDLVDSDFAALSRDAQGSGHLRGLSWTYEGALVDHGRLNFLNSALNQTCEVVHTTQGFRCISAWPEMWAARRYFADARCQQQIILRSSAARTGELHVRYASYWPEFAPEVVSVRRIGQEIPVTTLYEEEADGTCASAALSSCGSYLALEPEHLPLDSFPLVERAAPLGR